MLKKGNIYEIEIQDISHCGEGIGKIEGFTVFVEGAIPGDLLKIKIALVKKTYATGIIIEIIEPSIHRVNPLCSISNVCGGCQIMHMDYLTQLEMKTKRVKETLNRIGKIDTTVHPAIGMKNPYGYRNKAQFPIGIASGKILIGFYEKGSHKIADTDACMIQTAVNKNVVQTIKEYIEKFKVSVYDEKIGKGLFRHVVNRVGFTTGEIMVIIIANGKKLPHKKELIDLLIKNVHGLKSIVHNINEKNTNVILGKESITIFGQDYIIDYIGDLKFNISAHSFFQVNPLQTKVLYDKALEYAALTGEEIVFDIYCGIGTISLFMAQKAKKVYGIEVVKEAIKDADKNAKINQITNIEFQTGDAADLMPKLYKQGIKADVIIVDPPRKGCEEKVLETIAKIQPKRIIYVSCNPATLARDLACLHEHGFKTIEVQPVDMFPHTAHVESIALLQRLERL